MKIVEGSSTSWDVSSREVARRTDIPNIIVWVVQQRTLLCYPYKIQRQYKPLPSDIVMRITYGVGVQITAKDDDWLSIVLRTEEAHFTLRGSVNSHNCRIRATENPRTFVQISLHDENVTVWCGFTAFTAIGYFMNSISLNMNLGIWELQKNLFCIFSQNFIFHFKLLVHLICI